MLFRQVSGWDSEGSLYVALQVSHVILASSRSSSIFPSSTGFFSLYNASGAPPAGDADHQRGEHPRLFIRPRFISCSLLFCCFFFFFFFFFLPFFFFFSRILSGFVVTFRFLCGRLIFFFFFFFFFGDGLLPSSRQRSWLDCAQLSVPWVEVADLGGRHPRCGVCSLAPSPLQRAGAAFFVPSWRHSHDSLECFFFLFFSFFLFSSFLSFLFFSLFSQQGTVSHELYHVTDWLACETNTQREREREREKKEVEPFDCFCLYLWTCYNRLPTVAALGGASVTKNRPLDGHNIWPSISQAF